MRLFWLPAPLVPTQVVYHDVPSEKSPDSSSCEDASSVVRRPFGGATQTVRLSVDAFFQNSALLFQIGNRLSRSWQQFRMAALQSLYRINLSRNGSETSVSLERSSA